jgi:hypothetical protein
MKERYAWIASVGLSNTFAAISHYIKGLPDFSGDMIHHPKKCTKLTQNIPNGHK